MMTFFDCATITAILLSAIFLSIAQASIGENSQVFQKCMRKYMQQNCSTQALQIKFHQEQDYYDQLFGWTCADDVRYRCMWSTVRRFVNEDLPVPQFYGKWPFRRFYGLQEPASVLFSILNLITSMFTLVKLWRCKEIKTEMRDLWIHYGGLSCFTWFWSAIFHARDNPFTERMDYFSAHALVLFKLYSIVQRLTRNNYPVVYNFISAPFVGFYIYHVYRLNESQRFDYGYNMLVNCVVAAMSTLLWLGFVAYHTFKTHRADKVWRCALVVIAANLLLCLEIFDFPPIEYTLDAHALWHLGTVPLPLFWSRFIIDDLKYIDECDARNRSELEARLRQNLAAQEASKDKQREPIKNNEKKNN